MSRLNNKVAVITGGASGIGEAMVRRFHQEGALVVIADIAQQAGEQLAADLPGSVFVETDVADAASLTRMVATAVEHFGRLDILVNNAGIDRETDGLVDGDPQVWAATFAINQKAVMLGMQLGLREMRAQGSGVILNIASAAGLVAFAGRPAYCASKAAIIHLSKAAAIENADRHIRINALCPGCVQTPVIDDIIERSETPDATRERIEHMNPLAGIIPAEQVAAAATFLVSDEAAFITGVALPVDGGYTAQ